jgi:hypothetical protein
MKVTNTSKMWQTLKYLAMPVTNQNLIHEDILIILNLGNLRYDLVQKPLSCCLQSTDINTEACNNLVLPVVIQLVSNLVSNISYGYETRSKK